MKNVKNSFGGVLNFCRLLLNDEALEFTQLYDGRIIDQVVNKETVFNQDFDVCVRYTSSSAYWLIEFGRNKSMHFFYLFDFPVLLLQSGKSCI